MRFRIPYRCCTCGKPLFLYGEITDGFENKVEWGERSCKCPTLDQGQGYEQARSVQLITGNVDKYKKSIYCGDIIQECVVGQLIWNDDVVLECPIGEIIYRPPGFNTRQIRKGLVALDKRGTRELNLSTYDGIFEWPYDGIEIIGNTHMNPELLK